MNELAAHNLASLEEKILSLAKFGRPGVSLINGGWHCRIDMNTNAAGASFTVSSDFGVPTIMAAVDQCMQRVDEAIKTIRSAA